MEVVPLNLTGLSNLLESLGQVWTHRLDDLHLAMLIPAYQPYHYPKASPMGILTPKFDV